MNGSGRPPQPLFSGRGRESVARFPNAVSISASRYGPALAPFETSSRPANAFDGDPTTAWLVGGTGETVGNWVRVTFDRPRQIVNPRSRSPKRRRSRKNKRGHSTPTNWRQGSTAWPTEGNPFLWVIQMLQFHLDNDYQGRAA